MKPLIFTFLMFVLYAFAANGEPSSNEIVTFVDYAHDSVVYSNTVTGSNWIRKISRPPPPIPLPYTVSDVDSGMVFYVESDGRHVSAISPDGKIVWSRDPFLDSHLEHYRTDTPRIVWIGMIDKNDEPHQWIVAAMARKGVSKFVYITYNSTQSGCLDFRTGDFTFLGQN